MPEGGLRVGSILGIPIYLHQSWFIIFALMTYSLATQFSAQHPAWSVPEEWLAGIVTSLLFFASVVFHELGHSVVAQAYQIPVDSITLFVFGGLARISHEPERPIQEFNIAVAGPAASGILAGGFWLIGKAFPAQEFLGALCGWLGSINFMLAAFNLIPGFPLDGGRILRALVWWLSGSYARATTWASGSGRLFAYGMILWGVWRILNTNIAGGLWIAFLGWFLLTAATETSAQAAIRNKLAGVRARDIMSSEVPTMPRQASLEDYLQELLRTGQRCHLVAGGEQIVGLINVHRINAVPREEWDSTSVQAAMIPLDDVLWASPDDPVTTVLERMQTADINQMPVVIDGQVVGLITRDSILRIIQTRMELGKLAS
jgi:Zn-dependent protease